MTLKAPANVNNQFHFENFNHKQILQKFLDINELRLQRTKNSISQRQVDFLQVLPLLFHINHPLLPGFVSTECPTGLSKYNPDKDTLRCARGLAKSFEHKHRAYQKFDIYALYMMGSTGTIAYSESSDFDIWLCHREDLTTTELYQLHEKTQKISQWCKEFKLDVTFFMINTESFRQGKIDELSSESSGSTQHNLLLEEFYRTSILIAGRYPIWWIVPPEYEKEYDDFVQHVIHQRRINKNDFLNFGSMSKIPAEEFYGATLWHIYKGIDSPYKSILKLLLMECYAKEFPDINLLSLSYKKIIYQEENPDIDKLDPYIMLINKVMENLIGDNSLTRLELARRCFYLKVNKPLSKIKTSITKKALVPDWRQKIMSDMIKKWDWKQHTILSLDQRNRWTFDEINKEHKDILDALTYSYRQLSNLFRYQQEDIRINKRDLHILGRKLYAAFEKKAGKIEIINHEKSNDLLEQHVSLHPIPLQAKNKIKQADGSVHGWSLYLGIVNKVSQSADPIKKSSHLLKLLSWAYFNQLISSCSSFILAKQLQVLTTNELNQIVKALEKVFPDATPGYASINELIKPAQLGLNLLILNIGIDPFFKKRLNGSQITTSHTDALNYGAMHENLLISIDQVLFTSWREVMHNHFKEENGLMECLCQYLKWNSNYKNKSTKLTLPGLIASYSSVRSETISARITQLFHDVLTTFHHFHNHYHDKISQQENMPVCRYLISIKNNFYIIWQDENGAKYQKISDHKELIRELSYPLTRFNSLIIDRQFAGNKVIKLIFEKNKENHVQLFYQNHNKSTDIYIIDQFGSLYHQKVSIEKNSTHINHFMLFLDSIIKRICLNNAQCDLFHDISDTSSSISLDPHLNERENVVVNDDSSLEIQFEIYEIQAKTTTNIKLKNRFSKLKNMPIHFFSIQVIVDLDDNGKRLYIVYANEKEFSSFEYGQNLYKKVAEEIISSRKNKQRYPIYITDIDLSSALIEADGSQSIQITQLLKFKYEIERRLNQAIKNL